MSTGISLKKLAYLQQNTSRKKQWSFGGVPDTLSDWIDLYITLAIDRVRPEQVKKKIELHLYRFRDFFVGCYGRDNISICLKRDVVDWRNKLLDKELAHSTINNHLASFSAFTTWVHAKDPNIFPFGDPCKGIGELGLPPLEPRTLNEEQIRSLKNLCDRLHRFYQLKGRRWSKKGEVPLLANGRPWRDRAIVFVFLSTGLRREELVNINLDQVEPKTPEEIRASRKVKINGVKGKGKTQKKAFLSADARGALADYLELERPRDATENARALFLCASGIPCRKKDSDDEGRLSTRSINTILVQIGQWHDSDIEDPARKISPLRPHDLRHTFAFLLAKKTNADAYELQRRLGHRSQRYIQRYTNPPEDVAASYTEDF